ncbi:hypothetical protein EVAR_88554_1 [Eumeta japonica]|uniref:Uncharacterized protein n=1 Tax=Eumeta variegata TaxID=151549 RepID=A0A4C1WNG2_EUMVA|nr:hypothetical protein EVAR_88554_1 [Eumeta japonica]
MENANPNSVPVDPHSRLEKSVQLPDKNLPYREAVGSLMHVAIVSRPDIMFAVNLTIAEKSGKTSKSRGHVVPIPETAELRGTCQNLRPATTKQLPYRANHPNFWFLFFEEETILEFSPVLLSGVCLANKNGDTVFICLLDARPLELRQKQFPEFSRGPFLKNPEKTDNHMATRYSKERT